MLKFTSVRKLLRIKLQAIVDKLFLQKTIIVCLSGQTSGLDFSSEFQSPGKSSQIGQKYFS